MADVQISYEEMLASARKLEQARTDIQGQLEGLLKMVANLVQTSFKTQMASERFRQSYEQWDKGAKNAITGLESMSTFLNRAVQGHRDLDSNLTSGLSS